MIEISVTSRVPKAVTRAWTKTESEPLCIAAGLLKLISSGICENSILSESNSIPGVILSPVINQLTESPAPIKFCIKLSAVEYPSGRVKNN